MTENILVPIDGSKNSKYALRYACKLANKLGATVTVLYVVNTPYVGDSPSTFFDVDSMLADGQRILEAVKKIGEEEDCK